MTDFEQRLRKAIERGQRAGDARSRAEAEKAMSENELRRLHTQYRLELSERIEGCLKKLPQHFPGFRFESVVSDRPRFHHAGGKAKYNKQGRYFLTTLERAPIRDGEHTERGNDSQTGVVESPVFVLTGSAASFLVGGGSHNTTYVALCTEDGKEVLKASGRNSEIMRRVTWDTRKYVGKRMFLRVVDRHAGGWGHVTLDDFSVASRIDPDATAERRRKPRASTRPAGADADRQ